MSYLAVKHLHITCAAISGSFFIVRGIWKMRDSAMLERRWVRILPHLVDTLLLASALTMVFWSGQYPFVQNWLTAKVLALLAYIALGTIALKRGKTPAIRASALAAAVTLFGYILAVAISRQALPFLSF
ncbi:SirB2 family protein [Undibacterium piscinae]|uniref:SirB2 family protein n=1 Tax=Undibacterium piscinae TaxID=2495591 RepID=A0A6M4A8Y9_9BURK|nr:SirB2 family protein [Undibacterium piscinae]